MQNEKIDLIIMKRHAGCCSHRLANQWQETDMFHIQNPRTCTDTQEVYGMHGRRQRGEKKRGFAVPANIA